MALHTVADLKNRVSAALSDVDLQNVSDLYGAFETAAKVLIQKADIPEASNTQNINLYSGVINYPANTDMFGTAIRDIRPQGISRDPSDYVYKQPGDQFDRNKGFLPSGTITTFEYVAGVPTIRIVSKNVTQQIILDTMSATTGWTASGGASTPIADATFYYQTPASLRFNLASGQTTGSLTKTLTTPINLTAYQGVAFVFLAVEIPSATDITSIGIRIGSSSSNYYTVTNTTGFLGAFTAGQFFLVGFDLSQATTVGTPVITAINYLQVIFNYNSNQENNVRVGGLWTSLPSPNQILYQTAAIFKASGQNASTDIVVDTDTIILNDPAYNLFQYECQIAVLEQLGGATADSMIARIDGKLNSSFTRSGHIMQVGLYDLYRGAEPSQTLRTIGNYYSDETSFGNRFD